MNKGSSQKSRKNKALAADYVAIDDRSLIDLVHLTLEYAKKINFYNFRNKVNGNWNTFLLKDPAFIIAMIAATNTDKFKINHENFGNQQNESHKPEELNQYIRNIYKEIRGWHNLLSNTQYKGSLLNEIQNSLSTISSNWLTADNQNDPEANKENYEHLYGSLVFIKNQALKHFDEELKKSNHHPHIGLLLAFFKLFQNVQQDINSIPKKHLDFYFLDLLKQKRKTPKPHTALLALQLQQGVDSVDIPEGEKFEFVFGENQSLTFKASTDTQINKARIAAINTLYKSDELPFGEQPGIDKSFSISRLYEATIRKEETEKKKEQAPTEPVYFPATLGEESNMQEFAGNDIKQSEIGFLVSSPALILEKGKQNIQVTFKLMSGFFDESAHLFEGLIAQEIKQENKHKADREKLSKRIISEFFSDAFLIYITDKEGWNPMEFSSVRINHENNSLDFNIPFINPENTLVPFDNKIHGGAIETRWPCIKFILNNDTQYFPYKILKDIVVEEIYIKATVADVTRLKLSNSTGNLDNSIPFMPFGPTPVTGSFLRIQNPLIFQKNLTNLELNIDWLALPQVRDGFTSYYQAYPGNIDNNSFKAAITQSRNKLRGKEKQKLQEETLFKMDGEFLSNEKNITVKTNNFVFNSQTDTVSKPDENTSALYMVLTQPEIAFGHKIFNELYAEAAMKMSKAKKTSGVLPNPPYTPLIERLEVSYTNLAREIMLRKLDDDATDIKLVHLYPFGNVQVFPGPLKSQSYLLPQIEHNGNLFIGLKQVESGDIVNMGFELEPAVYVNTVINVPKIQWEYLLNNVWESLGGLVLEDTTDGLIRSGIVKIKMPGAIQFNNSRLPKGNFWIRAAYSGKEEVRSKIKNIFTQAVSLTSNDSAEFLPPNLSKNELSKKFTIEGRKNMGQIKGPYAFKLFEPEISDDTFYSRISEQLRHKNRVVSNWDVERIVLDKFKQIDKVRAYGRNSHPNELVKGSTLQVVLIPKNQMAGNNRIRSTKVDFSTLLEVKEYISQFVSPHVKVEVSNPVYEQLKIRCSVKFNNTQKSGYYQNMLNNELISYLSPDIENEFIQKGFDESISKTEILNFIESRPYVDFVTEFSVLQLVEVQGRYKIIDTAKIQKINDLRTISAYAILTSAPEHQISIIQDEKTEKSKVSGIGDLSVEADFIISDGDGNYI